MIETRYYKEYDYLNNITYLDVASMGLPPKRTLDLQKALEELALTEFMHVRG